MRYCEVLALGTKISPLKELIVLPEIHLRTTLGVSRGVGPSSVNFGPPNISESTRARKLKLKSQLDMVKYSR